MGDSLYRNDTMYCARCCTDLIAEERHGETVSVIVAFCPRCGHVVESAPIPEAYDHYPEARLKWLGALLERGRDEWRRVPPPMKGR